MGFSQRVFHSRAASSEPLFCFEIAKQMKKRKNYQAFIPSPIATLGLKLDGSVLYALDFIFEDIAAPIFENEVAELMADQLNAYFKNPQYQFSLNISPQGTIFQKSVWQQMQTIPSGARLTYGEVAIHLQSGARAVGNACRKNPIPLIIPCHRIVAKNSLGGFAGATSGHLMEVKHWLLKYEAGVIHES